MTYCTEWDDQGEEVLLLNGPFPFPKNYATREVDLAAENLVAGVDRFYLLVSRQTRFEAIQNVRNRSRGWGDRFALRDPRQFSSTP